MIERLEATRAAIAAGALAALFVALAVSSDLLPSGRLTSHEPIERPEIKSVRVVGIPVVIVTRHEITYQGQLIATPEGALWQRRDGDYIDALVERLDASLRKVGGLDVTLADKLRSTAREACVRAIQASPGTICPGIEVIIQVERSTDPHLIELLERTARRAGHRPIVTRAL